MMAPSSRAEWVQTAIQFFAFMGVGLYTLITYRMSREMKAQNQAIQEQLRLQREDLQHQRQLADEASHPVIEWRRHDAIQQILNSGELPYFFAVKANPISSIVVKSPNTAAIILRPADYLDVGTSAELIFHVPLTIARGQEPLQFHLIYMTKTGLRGQMDFECLGAPPGLPRKVGQGPKRPA